MRYQDVPEYERALEFPTRFPVKAIGRQALDIRKILLDVLDTHQAPYRDYDVHERLSSGGKYISVTVYIMAQSRRQLDGIYEDLRDRPEIDTTL